MDNGILFSMEAPAKFLAFPGRYAQLLPQASQVGAMAQPPGRAVIPAAEDALISDDKGTYLAAQAG